MSSTYNTYAHASLCLSTRTATTEIYTLSLHDALPISRRRQAAPSSTPTQHNPLSLRPCCAAPPWGPGAPRSEEHTSELQSRRDLVCRLLLEKKKKQFPD